MKKLILILLISITLNVLLNSCKSLSDNYSTRSNYKEAYHHHKWSEQDFLSAISFKDYDTTRKIIENNKSIINASFKDGYFPIHHAVINNSNRIIGLLIEKGVDLNSKDKLMGDSPLHLAVIYSNKEILEILIKNGADINSLNNIFYSPIALAIINDNKDIIDVLLSHDVKLNGFDDQVPTPLHVAIENGQKEIIEILLKHGAKTTIFDEAAMGRLDEVARMIKEDPELVNAKNDVIFLKGTTPLYYAAKYGHLKVCRLLLDNGAEVDPGLNEGRLTPLAFASSKEIAELLISRGADVNATSDGFSAPLIVAAERDNIEVADFLLSKGAKINDEDGDLSMALLEAVKHNNKEMVVFLLANGAEYNSEDNGSITILQKVKSKEVGEALLDHGFNVNSKGKTSPIGESEELPGGGWTPLHDAAYWGYKDVVELFLDKGANVNAKSDRGFTPLHLAAMNGAVEDNEVINILLEKKARINVKTKDGRTPLKLANEYNHSEIAELLRKHGAVE